jgi:hypothetical protein
MRTVNAFDVIRARRASLFGLAALWVLMSGSAMAGFLDERSPAARPPAARTAVEPAVLSGFGQAWSGQLQASAQNVPLHLALRILRPASEVVEILIPQDLMDISVTWPAEADRLTVLREVATRNHLLMKLDDGKLTVVKSQAAAAAGKPAPAPAPAPTQTFEVTAGDRSVREVLARWARTAGWTHEPVHWALDRDHPIQGAAGAELFGADFRSATRKLLSSTELTDRPVQPCFYLNKVVRVIPRAELCDRTQP